MNSNEHELRSCPKCQQLFSAPTHVDVACPQCGSGVESPDSGFEPLSVRDRTFHRVMFWILFLVTPAACVLLGVRPRWLFGLLPSAIDRSIVKLVPEPLQVLGMLFWGSVGAGYFLARLNAKPRATGGLILISLAYGLGLIVVYLAIVFVGCLVLVGAR